MDANTWLGLIGLVAAIAIPTLGLLIRVVWMVSRIETKLDGHDETQKNHESRLDRYEVTLGDHGNRLWRLETGGKVP